MDPILNIKNLVRQLLPIHKRQPERLKFFTSLTKGLEDIYDSYITWRKEIRRHVRVTPQVGILEHYIRTKYGVNAEISSYTEQGLQVGYKSEGTNYKVTTWLSPAADKYLEVVSRGYNMMDLEGVNYEIRLSLLYGEGDNEYNPDAITDSLAEIYADMEKYRPALMKFKIRAEK